MVTDPSPRLVTVIVLTMATYVTLTTAMPKLEPASETNRSDVEDKTVLDKAGSDQNPVVLKTETTEGKEPKFIEFSYKDDNKIQPAEGEDVDRYAYRIIDSPETSAGKSAVSVNDDTKDVKDTKEKQNIAKGREEGVAPVARWNVRRQTEFEENVPGFYNWPKHIPDHLRPLSPFDDDDRVIAKEQIFTPGSQTKRDHGFVPSGRLSPPLRAGPYLYPQSVVDREFRVPYN